jgi:hypothetical protein
MLMSLKVILTVDVPLFVVRHLRCPFLLWILVKCDFVFL